ncbi:MAG: beta strand repeat-containing protein, partial [Acidobacteriota bacterium]
MTEGTGISLNGLEVVNTGVLTVQGESGDVNFAGGSGINVSGTTISNTDAGSAQSIFKTIAVGSDSFSAGSNSDTITFAAGSGVTLTPNTTDKSITISAISGGSQWTTTGSDIYYNSGNVGIGNTAPASTLDVTGTARISGSVTLSSLGSGVVHSNGSGLLSSSAVNLSSSDVTGTLAVGNGGTGATTFTANGVVYGNGTGTLQTTAAPTSGQLLIANGSNVPTFATLSGGATVNSTGVLTIVLPTSDTSLNTSSNSGLEFSAGDGLSLLRGCSTGQVLKWNAGTEVWECANDTDGGGAGVINVENNDATVGVNVDTIDFGSDFTLVASPSNEANVSIADNALNFTEFSDTMSLDAATSIALSTFDLTLGTSADSGNIVIAPNAGGDAALIINKQGNNDIFTASASGTTRLTLTNSGDLNIIGGVYQIAGSNVLSSTALGSSVVNSSLTSVGVLSSGSIASGFGTINTTNTIQGSDITATGTTGFSASGNGAGLTFSGTGNHIINASSGTLQ